MAAQLRLARGKKTIHLIPRTQNQMQKIKIAPPHSSSCRSPITFVRQHGIDGFIWPTTKLWEL